jgi:hypothetical protein
MDLNDLYKLAGISRDDTPAIEPQPVEHVAEQPTDGRADMRAMIALITPEQLNQLVGEAPVEEGDEYAASTTPNPQEYKGTLGSPSDNSLRRYLGAAGDHVTVDETNVYDDLTVENVSEAYKSFKAKHKTEAYSSGDENEESIQESSADEFLKSLNQDPLYFPGAQITKNDDGSITLVASNGEEVGDIDVKTGDIVLVNGDDYNIADDEDAEQNLQTMYAEINGDNGDMDMDEAATSTTNEGRMKDMYTELEDLEPKIMRLKNKYMDQGMEPEEAQDMACEKLGCDPEMFDEYLTMKFDESTIDEAEIELAPGYKIKTDKPGIYKGTKTTSGFVGGKSGEAMYMANRVLDAIEYQDPASREEVEALARKFCKEMGCTDEAKKRVYKELIKMGWFDESLDEADIDENAFNQAAAAAARAGKDSFEFGGKTHKTTMKKDTAHKLDDDIDSLKKLAGL